MVQPEKIFLALKKCLRDDDCSHCDGCPYNHMEHNCKAQFRKDIITLLKSRKLAVHGKWISDSDGLPVCSICGEVAMQRVYCDILHEEWRYDIRLEKTPYCPNCGTKLDAR